MARDEKQDDTAARKPARARPAAAAKKPAEKTPAAAKAPAKAAAAGAKKPAGAKAPAAKAAAKADEAPAPKTRTRAAAKKPAEAKAPAKQPRAAAKPPAAAPTQTPAPVETAKPARTRSAAQTPAKPAAPLTRARKPRPLGPVTVRAQARYVRSSARKARLVCNHIRGKSVPEARALLAFAPRGVAADWAKLLDSAVANAEHNHELIGDELHVTAVYADEGPTLKRFRPRAMGRATPIHKRTSHLTIMLGSKE
jgi:ribosomal protein L22